MNYSGWPYQDEARVLIPNVRKPPLPTPCRGAMSMLSAAHPRPLVRDILYHRYLMAKFYTALHELGRSLNTPMKLHHQSSYAGVNYSDYETATLLRNIHNPVMEHPPFVFPSLTPLMFLRLMQTPPMQATRGKYALASALHLYHTEKCTLPVYQVPRAAGLRMVMVKPPEPRGFCLADVFLDSYSYFPPALVKPPKEVMVVRRKIEGAGGKVTVLDIRIEPDVDADYTRWASR